MAIATELIHTYLPRMKKPFPYGKDTKKKKQTKNHHHTKNQYLSHQFSPSFFQCKYILPLIQRDKKEKVK